jgi:TPR repeat protein
MSSDNSLAAACLRIYREYKPQNQATGTIAQLLEQDGFPLPATLSEAYATVWERYVERFPDRARQLLSKAPPPLPIPGANVTERNLERYNHAQRGLSSMAPSRAVAVFDELLFNEGGQLRPKPARHLALHLCRGSGIAQDRARGADLLMEAALRGDEDAALFLCQALVPPHVGEAIDEVLPFSKKVSVGLTPNAEVAGACARLFATKQDIGPAVLKVLRTNRIVCPATDEAYRLLWKHYMARRLTRKRRRE